jgi:acyl carrier protein phosphodiesterase
LNFLAHIYLSGDSEDLITGNFIADFVKGSQLSRFSPGVINGIRLHRSIDAYTDAHPVVRQSKERLSARYRKYAPVILDIFYDHFLAADWCRYSDTELGEFAAWFYRVISLRMEMLPERAQTMLPYMIHHNWLVSYANVQGIQKVLQGMSRRARFVSGMETAADELVMHYGEFREEFGLFFPDLKAFAGEEIRKLSR